MPSPTNSSVLPDLTGTTIENGRLRLTRLLGAGAYGKVYKAIDLPASGSTAVQVAVKCMPNYKAGSRDALMVKNELAIHRSVSAGRNISTLHRVFTTPDYVFAVMDVSRETLFEELVEKRRFRGRLDMVKEVFGEILDGVEYMHDHGIFHRDLKPENILCGLGGSDVRISDFGLATTRERSTQFGCGSRFYMSPESLSRDPRVESYSAKDSDLWACAILLATMVSACHPWATAELTDRGYQGYLTDPRYLKKALNLTVPAFNLFNWCFQHDPAKRPSLKELRIAVELLDAFVTDEPRPRPGLSGRPNPYTIVVYNVPLTVFRRAAHGEQKAVQDASPVQSDVGGLPVATEMVPAELKSELTRYCPSDCSSCAESRASISTAASDAIPPPPPFSPTDAAIGIKFTGLDDEIDSGVVSDTTSDSSPDDENDTDSTSDSHPSSLNTDDEVVSSPPTSPASSCSDVVFAEIGKASPMRKPEGPAMLAAPSPSSPSSSDSEMSFACPAPKPQPEAPAPVSLRSSTESFSSEIVFAPPADVAPMCHLGSPVPSTSGSSASSEMAPASPAQVLPTRQLEAPVPSPPSAVSSACSDLVFAAPAQVAPMRQLEASAIRPPLPPRPAPKISTKPRQLVPPPTHPFRGTLAARPIVSVAASARPTLPTRKGYRDWLAAKRVVEERKKAIEMKRRAARDPLGCLQVGMVRECELL